MKKALTIGIITLLIGFGVVPSVETIGIEQISISTINGNTLYVGGTGPGNYSRIQNAIDNASDGDTIFVYNGIYYESISIHKTIDLIGENKNNTIIEGDVSERGDILKITKNSVTIKGFTVRNCSKYHPDAAIHIKSDQNTIVGNIITNGGDSGINIESTHNFISNNIISNCDENGICIVGDSNTIKKNEITNTRRDGICLSFGSKNNVVEENIIIENGACGILLYSSANKNVISNNDISSNSRGIHFYRSNNNVISENEIANNKNHGIYIFESGWGYPSENNEIYFNNFINNTKNAYDECGNKWHKISLMGCIGNYWDDYNGRDTLLPHGTGDTPYKILGGSNIDRFPLMNRWPQSIDAPFLHFLVKILQFFPLLERIFAVLGLLV